MPYISNLVFGPTSNNPAIWLYSAAAHTQLSARNPRKAEENSNKFFIPSPISQPKKLTCLLSTR